MDTSIRDIGNSQGVIIPAALLKEANLSKTVNMYAEEGRIILQSKPQPRAGWAEAIDNDPPTPQEPLFMDGIDDEALLNEWTW